MSPTEERATAGASAASTPSPDDAASLRRALDELAEAQEALRTSERRLRAAVEGSGDGLWDWDATTDRHWMNDRWATMLGWDPAEIGDTVDAWRSLIHPDDYDAVMAALDAHIAGHTDRYQFEHRLRRKDGTYAWILDRGMVIEWGPDGRPLRAAGTHTDVTERHETEERLRATSARLERLLDAMDEGVLHYGIDGSITGLNRRAAEVAGVTPEEAVGTRPGEGSWRLVDEHGRALPGDRHPSAIARRTGQRVHDQFAGIQRADGHITWVTITSVPARLDEHGDVLEAITTFSDVSELRAALDAKSASEARLREVLETTADAVYVLDGGVIEWANAATADIFGRSLDELIGLPFVVLLARDDVESFRELRQRAADGGTVDVERRIVRPDGEVRWLEIRAHSLGDGRTEAVARDITARKALEAERARLALAVAQSSDGIIIADADARITYVNPAMTELSGFAPQETIGRPLGFSSPDGGPTTDDILAAIRTTGSWSGDRPLGRKDGSVVTMAVRASRLLDGGGRLTGYLVTARDVTYERALEIKLADAARMESIGQLAGGVAHDFNNILTAILGNAELAAAETDPGTPVADDLAEITKAARRAQALTSQLLAFGRRAFLQPRDVRLGDVVDHLAPMLRRLIGEDIELLVERGPDEPFVRVDPALLDHAVTNLIVNARDAMPGGGTITVAADAAPTPGRARLRVTDTGSGMPPDVVGRIFDPFFTTKEVGKGTGLGLSMVQGFVMQSGGEIEVHSAPGQGTTFTILLPLSFDPAPLEGDAGRAAGAPAHAGSGTVLVVEDEAVLREIAQRVLVRAGYDVILASHGGEALAVLETDAPVDVLFTDIVMPGISGLDLAARGRVLRPGMRTLVTSGYTADEMDRRGISIGDTPFLPKPYQPHELLEAVAALAVNQKTPPRGGA